MSDLVDDLTEAEPVARGSRKARSGASAAAPLPFEGELWNSADRMRGQVEESEYKHVVLGLIFLKYISDAFDHRRAEIVEEVADTANLTYYLPDESDRAAALEDRDYYVSRSVAWVPADSRWEVLQRHAKSADIGVRIDAAMDKIEAENHELRGVLPKNYARPEIPANLLGQLIDLFSKIGLKSTDDNEDILGRVYEYFLGKFGANEGGQYYTPQQVVQLLVEMLEPARGRIFDPACGSGGMFVQSAKFVDAHGGTRGDIRIFGQEAVATTWRLAKMNLAIRHIEADLGDSWGDSFHDDRHKDLRADFVIANPPFNLDEWDPANRLAGDARWVYGKPPQTNANFAWVQHFLGHLSPTGTAGFVLANGSLSVQGAEGEIRRRIIEADLVDCIVALPGNLFFGTPISVSLWFLTKSKRAHGHRDREGETLFVDARSAGRMVTTTQRVLSRDDVERIAATYRQWRAIDPTAPHVDVPGFCAAVDIAAIERNRFALTPARYVGAEAVADTGDPAERIRILRARLAEQVATSDELARQLLEQINSLP